MSSIEKGLKFFLALGTLITLIYTTHDALKIKQSKPSEEKQINICIDKIASGEKYITIVKPVSNNTKKLLKDEHYEPYLELNDNKKIIYKKSERNS